MTKTPTPLPALFPLPSGPSAATVGHPSVLRSSEPHDSMALEPCNTLAVADRNNGLDTALTSLAAPRSSDGRFGPGNPGRPKGSRNRTSQAVEVLLAGEAEVLTRKAVELALAGDTTALRLCLERLCPPRKDAPVTLDLPLLHSARDAADAVGAVVAAVGRGELTPQEGVAVVGLIDAYRRTLELTELEARVAELEEAVRATP